MNAPRAFAEFRESIHELEATAWEALLILQSPFSPRGRAMYGARWDMLGGILLALALGAWTGCSEEDASTRADTTPPVVESTSPARDATGIDIGSDVRVTFSESIDDTSFASSMFFLDHGVAGEVSCDARTATFNPAQDLAYGTMYTATVRKGIADMAGNTTKTDYTWRFTTESPPAPIVDLPIDAGSTWLYQIEIHNTAGSWGGWSYYDFVGRRVLWVAEDRIWQGGPAKRVIMFDIADSAANAEGLKVEEKFVRLVAEGFDCWYGSATGGSWHRVFSNTVAEFGNCGFLLSAGPLYGETTKMSSVELSVLGQTVPALMLRHEYRDTGPYATVDVFEDDYEYYVSGVGPVKATWSISVDDNDPQGVDTEARGTIELAPGMPPDGYLEIEPNDGTQGDAQAIGVPCLVAAETAISDLGRIVTEGELHCMFCVSPNELEEWRFQDWYRFESSGGHIMVNLAYEYYNPETDIANDLDLFLLREEPGGALSYWSRSSAPEAKGEWISAVLDAGAYYIVVQAWKNVEQRVPYWISVR